MFKFFIFTVLFGKVIVKFRQNNKSDNALINILAIGILFSKSLFSEGITVQKKLRHSGSS